MHHVAGEYSEAIRRGREALPLVERLGLDTLQVQVHYSIGVSRVQLGDADGIADIERGLSIAQAINSFELLHASSNNLSDAQFFLGKVAEAARTYEALMESVERFGRDTDRRWARASMALIRTSDGHWDEAVALADQFIAEVEAGSPHYLEAPCRAARASIRFARGDLAGASADAEAAVEAGRAAKDPQVLVPALQIRAVILAAEGRRAEAETLLDELIALGAGVVAGVSGFGWGIVDLAWLAEISTGKTSSSLFSRAPLLFRGLSPHARSPQATSIGLQTCSPRPHVGPPRRTPTCAPRRHSSPRVVTRMRRTTSTVRLSSTAQ